MSEIKVDTLTGKTTANDITVTVGASATQSLEQGLAKAHLLFDQRGSHIGTANTAGSSSLNISSTSDDAAGNYSLVFTNNMSNDEYTPVCSAHYNGLVGNKDNPRFSGPYTILTTGYSASVAVSNGSTQDGIAQTVVHGDLA